MTVPFQLELSPNPTKLGLELVSASERLAQTTLCREILAENMLFSGGIERLYQRLFLWAFHTQGANEHFLALELRIEPLAGNEALDVLCYRWSPETKAAFENRFLTQVSAAEWFTNAVGAVEAKDNWNRASIPSDIAKLRRIHNLCLERERDRHEYYELLLIHTYTFDDSFDIEARIAQQWEMTRKVFVKYVPRHEVVGATQVLDGGRITSDPSARTTFVAVLLRIHFDS